MYKPPQKLDCDVKNLTRGFEEIQIPTAQLSVQATQLLNTIYELYPIWQQLAETCLHLHAMHYHTVGADNHEVTDRTTTSTTCVLATGNEHIDGLTLEQNSFTDVQETGLIFGRDYAFGYELDLPRFYKSMFDPDVNEFSEDILDNLQSWQDYFKEAMDKLYMSDSESCTSTKKGVTPANMLIMEFFKEEDVDDNGQIYGIDFMITDESAPPELLDINATNGLNESDIPLQSWNEYLETISGEPPMEIFQISPFTKQELVDELIGEFLSCQDVNDDGLVYGKDFLIIGEDKPAQLNQYVPLYLPNIITSWSAYVKSREYNQPNNLKKYEQLLKDEFDQNQDLDGNGLIYGVNFVISDYRDHFDDEIAEITVQQANINGVISMSLSAYHQTIKPYIENYVLDENIQAAKYNAEWLDKRDVDGNGLVYGRDFILSDYEENKTECLWTIEKYRNYTLEWTDDKVEALGLGHMLSTYTQTEFDQYWRGSEFDDNDDGPSIPETDTEGGNDEPNEEDDVINYDCNPDTRPIIPIEFNSINLSGHVVLYDGKYWFDLGIEDTISSGNTYLRPDGISISLLDKQIQRTFDNFNDAVVYFIKTEKDATSEDPYIFIVGLDVRQRVYISERSFSLVDECLDINESTISSIESQTTTLNFIVVTDSRTDASVPFDQDLTGCAIRWLYDSELESGKWVLCGPYERVVNRVIVEDSVDPCCQICVPLYKDSDEFKHFLPYCLNVTWNDIQ